MRRKEESTHSTRGESHRTSRAGQVSKMQTIARFDSALLTSHVRTSGILSLMSSAKHLSMLRPFVHVRNPQPPPHGSQQGCLIGSATSTFVRAARCGREFLIPATRGADERRRHSRIRPRCIPSRPSTTTLCTSPSVHCSASNSEREREQRSHSR